MRYVHVIAMLVFCAASASLSAQWIQKNGYAELRDSVGNIHSVTTSADMKTLYILSQETVKGKLNDSLIAFDIPSGLRLWSKCITNSSQRIVAYASLSSDSHTYLEFWSDSTLSAKAHLIAYSLQDGGAIDSVDIPEKAGCYGEIDYSYRDSLFYLNNASLRTAQIKNHLEFWTEGNLYQISRVYSPLGRVIDESANSYSGVIGSITGSLYTIHQYSESTYNRDTTYCSVRKFSHDNSQSQLHRISQSKTQYPDPILYQLSLSKDERQAAITTPGGLQFLETKDSITVSIPTVSRIIATSFSTDNKYLFAIDSNDNLMSFHTSLLQVCGVKKIPFRVPYLSRLVRILANDSIIICGSDGRIRVIPALSDTISVRCSMRISDSIKHIDSVITCTAQIENPENVVVTWEFGDGARDTGLNVFHRYAQSGNYTVSMTVKDTIRLIECSQNSRITVVEKAHAAFVADTLFGSVPLNVHFTDKSTGHVVWRTWLFGTHSMDSSNEENPNFVFRRRQGYSITLIVSDGIENDTCLKILYINADNYPYKVVGGDVMLRMGIGSSTRGFNYVKTQKHAFTHFQRTNSGAVYLVYENADEESYQSGGPVTTSSTNDATVFRLHDDMSLTTPVFLKNVCAPTSIGFEYPATIRSYCDSTLLIRAQSNCGGTISIKSGLLRDSTFTACEIPLSSSMQAQSATLDSYVLAFGDSTRITYVLDTNSMIINEVIHGHAVPAVENENSSARVQIVTAREDDSLSEATLHVRSVDEKGKLLRVTTIAQPHFEKFEGVCSTFGNELLLVGEQEIDKTIIPGAPEQTPGAVIVVMSCDGLVKQRVSVPQWLVFNRIDRLSDSVFAIGGESSDDVYNKGFVLFHLKGEILADVRIVQQGIEVMDYSFISDSNDVVYGGMQNLGGVLCRATMNMRECIGGLFNPHYEPHRLAQPSAKTDHKYEAWCYPNPTHGPLTVVCPTGPRETVQCELFNTLGERLLNTSVAIDYDHSSFQLDLGPYAQSFYFLRLSGEWWSSTISVPYVRK